MPDPKKKNLRLFVVEANQKPITKVRFELKQIASEQLSASRNIKIAKSRKKPLNFKKAMAAKDRREGIHVDNLEPGRYLLKVMATGFESQEREILVGENGKIISEYFVMAKKGTPYFYKGNVRLPVSAAANEFGIKVDPQISKGELRELTEKAKELGAKIVAPKKHLKEQGFLTMSFPKRADKKSTIKAVRSLRSDKRVEHVNQMTQCNNERVSILTDEIVVEFDLNASKPKILAAAKKYGLEVIEQYPGAANLYLLRTKRKKGYDLLDTCRRLVEDNNLIISAEPLEIATSEDDLLPPLDYLYGEHWHLGHANIPAAWNLLNGQNPGVVAGVGTPGDLTYGSDNIIIGCVDRGLQSFTPPWGGGAIATHHDFRGNVASGANKIVAFYDFTNSRSDNNAPFSAHGMGISGVAAGMVNTTAVAGGPRFGIIGAAPNARVIGVIRSSAGAAPYPGMFQWLAGLPNTSPAPALAATADIISNSWNIGLAAAIVNNIFDQLTNYGRNGRGVLLFFSAGNGNADVTIQRPLAAHAKTFGIAATTRSATGTELRATYSGFGVFGAGTQIELSAPSSTLGTHVPTANFASPSGALLHAGNMIGGPGSLTATLTRATAIGDSMLELDTATGFRPGQQILIVNAANNIQENFTINATLATGIRTTRHIDISPSTVTMVHPATSTRILGVTQLTTTISPAGIIAAAGINILPVASIVGFQSGQQLLLGAPGAANQELRTISGVPAGANIPIGTNIANNHPLGDPITVVGGQISTTLVSLAGGNTILNVPTSAGFLPGHTLMVGAPGFPISPGTPSAPNRTGAVLPGGAYPEPATVLTVAPTSITVTTALVGGHAAGVPIAGGANHLRNNFSGTSSATPLAAGISALVLTAQPLLSWIELRDILRTTAVQVDRSNVGFAAGQVSAPNGRVLGQGIWQDANGVDTIVQGTGLPNGAAGAAHYSEWYGYGQVNAGGAVTAAIAYNHNQRDLMLRNWLDPTVLDVNGIPTQDSGLVATVVGTNPIQSPDIWIRNANDAFPGLDFNKDGPHQNPSQGVNRFIYARVINRGNLLSSLDAWVRFYVALSNGAVSGNVPAITTPFHFPTDWMAGNAIGTMGANAGANTTYFVGEVAMAAGDIAAGANNIVNIQWNQANLPPAATALNTYLLVQVAPTDGALNGRGAESVNNLSYREILFARFGFKDSAGAADLAQSIEVNPFFQAVTTSFKLLLDSDIGSFGTEKVRVELTRENDNGTLETAIFQHDTGAGTWGFTGTAPTWATMNDPLEQGTAVAAVGNKTSIAFDGTVDVAKEHNKLILKLVVTSRTTNSVIAFEEKEITVQAEQLEPTGINPSAPKVAPRSHVFADMTNLVQIVQNAYGPVPGSLQDKYRVTSSFTSASAVKAFACVNGFFMIQKLDANRINLILKPIKQPGLDFTPIRYFIYRGLRLTDFIKVAPDEDKVRDKAGASPLIARLYEIHEDQNTAGTLFESTALGYDPTTQLVSDKIDNFFYKSDPNFQLPFVMKGMEMGTFFNDGGIAFGFEIILEEGNYEPTLGFAQSAFHEVDVSSMAGGSIAAVFSKHVAREEVLNFLDPAAFYSMHAVDKGLLEVPDPVSPGDILKKKDDEIYTDVISKFFTKNKLYVDIRNENGHSYDFYKNYVGPITDPNLGQNFRIGNLNTVAGTPITNYKTEEWPIIIRDTAVNVNTDINLIFLALRIDDNLKPLLYVDSGKINFPAGKTNPFIESTDLLPGGANPAWTKVIGFDTPNTGPNGAKLHKAWCIKLFYNRQLDAATNWLNTVVKTTQYSDNIFGPIDFSPLWSTDKKIKWMGIQDKHLVDGSANNFVYMAERGLSFEGFDSGDPNAGRVIFYGMADDWLKAPGNNTTLANGLTGGVSTRDSFFQVADFFQGLQLQFDIITVGGNKVTILQLMPGGAPIPPSSMLVLGITRPQFTTLKALAGFQTKIDRSVLLEKIADATDDSGKSFTTYRLKVHGLDTDGHYKVAQPAADIVVFTADGFLFASDDFTKDEPIPTSYSRNAEEHIGSLQRAKPAVETWEDFFIKKDGPGPIAGIVDNSEITVNAFIAAVNGVVNDAIAKANLITHIDNFAPQILQRSRAFASQASYATADDRILYWARIKMIVALKSHELMLQSFSDRDELVKHFEIKSRGLDTVNFSAVPGGTKKVLITGFDPFFLSPTNANHNTLQSNPSGAAALALHGSSLTDGTNNAFIQSAMIPVRYRDFDQDGGEGIIEEFFKQFIDPGDANFTPVDIIFTMSQGSVYRFDIDRFASRFRAGTQDNEFIANIPFPNIPVGDQFYETTLPAAKIVPAVNPVGARYPIFFNQTYQYRDATAALKSYLMNATQGPVPINDDPAGADATNLLPTNQNQTTINAVEGSGGDYLSNEIFYRVSRLRQKFASALPTGHLHVPLIQGPTAVRRLNANVTNDFNAANMKLLIDEISSIILKSIAP